MRQTAKERAQQPKLQQMFNTSLIDISIQVLVPASDARYLKKGKN